MRCAAFFREHARDIDGIIVILPNFGDELGVVNAVKLSGLDVPILVQASDDENDKVDVKHRRDAFCGKLSVCNNFYQYGIKFTDTTYHTCRIESEAFEKDIHRFAAICRVVKGLKNLRVGAVGARPAGFQTMRYSEKILQQSDITVVPVDMSEILAAAEKIGEDSPEVMARARAIESYGTCMFRHREQLLRQSRFGLALERWIDENDVNITALQCWNSLEKNFGCAACVTMAMMGEK